MFFLDKPGKCPTVDTPDPLLCQSLDPTPGSVLCGYSASNGGSADDSDCPGESKCCLDSDTGCFQVCTLPENGKDKKVDLKSMVNMWLQESHD